MKNQLQLDQHHQSLSSANPSKILSQKIKNQKQSSKMDQDESHYFYFSRLTNRYPSEVQHQASREMVMIINNKIKPPGGEPIWSWYSRAEQLDYLKGFLKPIAVEKGETVKAKDPEVYCHTFSLSLSLFINDYT
ncbi:hypothetical protein ABN254_21455 [Providencia rettgeri]